MSDAREPTHEDDDGAGSRAAGTGGARYAIVVARYYRTLSDRLVAGALNVLAASGTVDVEEDVDVHEVPGAFEIPFAAALLAGTEAFAGVICLGAVIRGETSHYDIVCQETARGIQEVQLTSGVPCGFGVLTCDDLDQAMGRSGGGASRHAGEQAASAVLALSSLRRRLTADGAR